MNKFVLIFLFLLIASYKTTAQASLNFCNDTGSKLYLAVAKIDKGSWVTTGWYRMEAGSCVTPVAGRLNQTKYYYNLNQSVDDYYYGVAGFCTKQSAFTLTSGNCKARGLKLTNFRLLDTVYRRDNFTFRVVGSADAKIKPGPSAPLTTRLSNQPTATNALYNLRRAKAAVYELRRIASWQTGPFKTSRRCEWGCGFLDLSTCWRKWSVTNNYNWTREELLDWLGTIPEELNIAQNEIKNARSWFSQRSSYARRAAHFTNQLMQYQEAIKAGNNVHHFSQKIREVVASLRSDSDNFSSQLLRYNRMLTTKISLITHRRKLIDRLVKNAKSNAISRVNSDRQDYINDRCNSGIAERYSSIMTHVSSRADSVTKAFPSLNSTLLALEKQLASIASSSINAHSKNKKIREIINSIETDDMGGFMQKLHIGGVQKQWETMWRDVKHAFH